MVGATLTVRRVGSNGNIAFMRVFEKEAEEFLGKGKGAGSWYHSRPLAERWFLVDDY